MLLKFSIKKKIIVSHFSAKYETVNLILHLQTVNLQILTLKATFRNYTSIV